MIAHTALMLSRVADVSAAGDTMKSFVQPVMITLVAIGSLVATFFLIHGGFQYITSTGKPDKLDHAKKIVRNALIGLVILIAAGTLTAILSHAYSAGAPANVDKLPSLVTIQPAPTSSGITDILIKAIVGLFKHIIESAAKPFLAALDYFTKATPLMADNGSVFKLWLTVVGITDALFVLAVALLGFHVMSYASLGLDEIELKHLIPQFALAFLLVNTSIFAVDAVISLSNALISAINAAFPSVSVFGALSAISAQAGGMGLVALIIMVVFLVMSIILLVYYVTRLVTLYIGAILSPLVVLLWLVPSFKDFAATATKTYVTTIFVLFIHVIILQLAASIFGGMIVGSSDHSLNPLMATVVGVATIISLLKTQKVLTEMSYVSVGPKAIRKLGTTFVHSASTVMSKAKSRDASSKQTKSPEVA